MKTAFTYFLNDTPSKVSGINFRYQQDKTQGGERATEKPKEVATTNTDPAGTNEQAAEKLATSLPKTPPKTESLPNPEKSATQPETPKTPETPQWAPEKGTHVVLPDGKVTQVGATLPEKGAMAYMENGEIKMAPIPDRSASISEGVYRDYVGNNNKPDVIETGKETSQKVKTELQDMASKGVDGIHGEALAKKLADMPAAMTEKEAAEYRRNAHWDIGKGIVNPAKDFADYSPEERARADAYQNAIAQRGDKPLDTVTQELAKQEQHADRQETIKGALNTLTAKIPEGSRDSTRSSYEAGFKALENANGETKQNIERALGTKPGDAITFSDGRTFNVTGHKDGQLLVQGEDAITGGTVEQKIPYDKFRGQQLQDGTLLSGIYEKTFGGNLDAPAGSQGASTKEPTSAPPAPTSAPTSVPQPTKAPVISDGAKKPSEVKTTTTQPEVKPTSLHSGVPDNAPPPAEQAKTNGSSFHPDIQTRQVGYAGKYTVADDKESGFKVAKFDDFTKVGNNLTLDEDSNIRLGTGSVEFKMKYKSNEVEEVSYFDERGEPQYIKIKDGIIPDKFKKHFEVLKRMGLSRG